MLCIIGMDEHRSLYKLNITDNGETHVFYTLDVSSAKYLLRAMGIAAVSIDKTLSTSYRELLIGLFSKPH